MMVIQLSFDDETEEYVRLMCTRKGFVLEDYILDNFEWDDTPDCLYPDVLMEIPAGMCDGCEFSNKCPDAVGVK
jgi:hypothetical protein